jgi:hypothetical protein
MFIGSYLATALATTLNIALNALTRGRYVWLEGRVRRGGFKNWGRRYRCSLRWAGTIDGYFKLRVIAALGASDPVAFPR